MISKYFYTFAAFALALFFVAIVILIGLLFISILNKITQHGVKSYSFSTVLIAYFVGFMFLGLMYFYLGLFGLLDNRLVVLSLPLLIAIYSLFHNWNRIHFLKLYEIQKWIKNNKYISFIISFLLLILVLKAAVPVISFDGIWYHIPITKEFIQGGDIDFTGEDTRYSVHPYLNFFTNIPIFSSGFDTGFNSMIANLVYLLTYLLAVAYAYRVFRKRIQNNTVFLLGLIGLTFSEPLFLQIGILYNDILGAAFGLVGFIYVYKLHNQKFSIQFRQIILAVILIFALFSLKIFFSISAFILSIYFLTVLLLKDNKIDTLFSTKLLSYKVFIKHNFLRGFLFLCSGFIIFAIPWMIRAYYWTDLPLYPVGKEGFSEGLYIRVAGSTNNYWTRFVWIRLFTNISNFLWDWYGPLAGLGFLYGFREKISNQDRLLWLFLVVGFVFLNLLNIINNSRYQLAFAAPIIILGLVFFSSIWNNNLNKISRLTASVLIIIIAVLSLKQFNRQYWIDHSNKDYNEYLIHLANNGHPNVKYYQKSARTPNDLKENEGLFLMSFINKTGYFDNPVFSFHNNYNKKPGEDFSFSDFKDYLDDKDIRYILYFPGKRIPTEWCQNIGMVDYEMCDLGNTNNFTFVLEDKKQNVFWYKVVSYDS